MYLSNSSYIWWIRRELELFHEWAWNLSLSLYIYCLRDWVNWIGWIVENDCVSILKGERVEGSGVGFVCVGEFRGAWFIWLEIDLYYVSCSFWVVIINFEMVLVLECFYVAWQKFCNYYLYFFKFVLLLDIWIWMLLILF